MTSRKTAFARNCIAAAFDDATTALNDIDDLRSHAELPASPELDAQLNAAREALEAAHKIVKNLSEDQ